MSEEVLFDAYDRKVRVTTERLFINGTTYSISSIKSAELDLKPVLNKPRLLAGLIGLGVLIFACIGFSNLTSSSNSCMLVTFIPFAIGCIGIAASALGNDNSFRLNITDIRGNRINFPIVDKGYAQSAVNALTIAIEEFESRNRPYQAVQVHPNLPLAQPYQNLPVDPILDPFKSNYIKPDTSSDFAGTSISTFSVQPVNPYRPEGRVEFTKPLPCQPEGRVEFTKPLPCQPESIKTFSSEFINPLTHPSEAGVTKPLPEQQKADFTKPIAGHERADFTRPLPLEPEGGFTRPLPDKDIPPPSGFTGKID